MLKRPCTAIQRFLFTEVGAETLCLFRLVFGIFFVVQLLGLAPLLLTYFPDSAPIPIEAVRAHEGGAWTLLTIVRTDTGVILFYMATLLAAVCGAAGIATRIAIPLTLLAFLQWRNAALFIWDGGDIVSTTILYHLSLAALAGHCGKRYAVDAILQRRHAGSAREVRTTVPAWTLRLLQVQLCLIYFFSAWYKTQRPDWQGGEAVHYVVQQLTWSRIDLTWISSLPALAALLSYLVLVFQMSFPFLVWVREIRTMMLWSAVAFHATVELTMSIFAFPVMIFYPMVFVSPDTLRFWLTSGRGILLHIQQYLPVKHRRMKQYGAV